MYPMTNVPPPVPRSHDHSEPQLRGSYKDFPDAFRPFDTSAGDAHPVPVRRCPILAY